MTPPRGFVITFATGVAAGCGRQVKDFFGEEDKWHICGKFLN